MGHHWENENLAVFCAGYGLKAKINYFSLNYLL